MSADPDLTSDPVLQSVEVIKNGLDAEFEYTVVCQWLAYFGAVPIYAETRTGQDGENLASDFFSTTVAADVGEAYNGAHYDVPGSFTLPPVATDLTVWDPTTNAPYP